MPRVKRLRVRNGKGQRELFSRKKSFAFLLFILASILLMLASYAVFDNNRVRVDRVSVSVPTLPRELEGYSLLHITDLNGRYFSEDQSGIAQALGNSSYQAILFTGNMVHPKTQDPQAFYDLIDALSVTDKPMYFIPGNTDPSLYVLQNGACSASDFLKELTARKVTLLETPLKLRTTQAGALWLWPAEQLTTDAAAAIATSQGNIAALAGKTDPASTASRQYNELLLKNNHLLLAAREASVPEDIILAASHYPVTPARIAEYSAIEQPVGPSPLDAELIIAGHYLAGQWRFPPLGTLYVDAPSLPRGGWLPAQSEIAGLSRPDAVLTQYIGRGLGAAGPSWLNFRLFNTPEVAIIRLTSQVEVR